MPRKHTENEKLIGCFAAAVISWLLILSAVMALFVAPGCSAITKGPDYSAQAAAAVAIGNVTALGGGGRVVPSVIDDNAESQQSPEPAKVRADYLCQGCRRSGHVMVPAGEQPPSLQVCPLCGGMMKRVP